MKSKKKIKKLTVKSTVFGKDDGNDGGYTWVGSLEGTHIQEKVNSEDGSEQTHNDGKEKKKGAFVKVLKDERGKVIEDGDLSGCNNPSDSNDVAPVICPIRKAINRKKTERNEGQGI